MYIKCHLIELCLIYCIILILSIFLSVWCLLGCCKRVHHKASHGQTTCIGHSHTGYRQRSHDPREVDENEDSSDDDPGLVSITARDESHPGKIHPAQEGYRHGSGYVERDHGRFSFVGGGGGGGGTYLFMFFSSSMTLI